MINLKNIYCEAVGVPNLLTESKKSHLKHLFEDGTLTFDDMRNVFNNVFTGKVRVFDNVKKVPLQLTYKDGNFMIANDDNTIKEPFTADAVCKKCKCEAYAHEAVETTVENLIKGLSKLDQVDLNSIFANGQNFFSVDIVIPAEATLKDYGNKCFMQCNKVNCYDSTFKNVVEDEDNSTKIADKMKLHKSIIMNNPEINIDTINKLKTSTSPDMALKELTAQLAKIVDGIGYKATVNDYVRERYAKYIVNCAMQKGIDLYHNSNFVNELIARLSYVADHRPNKADLITYAKRDGVDWKSPEYKELIDYLESTADETNDQIVKPVEDLICKAGILLLKCFLGLTASDPRHSARKMCPEIESTIDTLREDEGLTPEKIACLRKCVKNLDAYQQTLPEEGIMIMHNGKVCSIKGTFGAINQLIKLINY